MGAGLGTEAGQEFHPGIDAPEEVVDDEDWVPDAEEVEELAQRARRAEGDGPDSPDGSKALEDPQGDRDLLAAKEATVTMVKEVMEGRGLPPHVPLLQGQMD
eukprot:jgi/Botrbrau1/752/Bobra.0181s0011.1